MWSEPAAIPSVLTMMRRLSQKPFTPQCDGTHSDQMQVVCPDGEPNYHFYLISDVDLKRDLEQPHKSQVLNWAIGVWGDALGSDFYVDWLERRERIARQFAWMCREPLGYPCYVLVAKNRVVRASEKNKLSFDSKISVAGQTPGSRARIAVVRSPYGRR